MNIDFTNKEPVFDNGQCKWFSNTHFNKYLRTKQADNLPKLTTFMCFDVTGDNIDDLVLIDGKQNILGAYPNDYNGYEQMTAKINILKISKSFDNYEKTNI